MTRAALIDRLNAAYLFGMDEADVPEYDSLHDMMVYSYYVLNGDEMDIKFSIYWFNAQPRWFTEGEMTRIYELEPKNPDTAYLSQGCLSIFSNGDSGCHYLIGENSFTTRSGLNAAKLCAAKAEIVLKTVVLRRLRDMSVLRYPLAASARRSQSSWRMHRTGGSTPSLSRISRGADATTSAPVNT